LILAVAAARQMTMTGLSASANNRRGINQTPVVAIAVNTKNWLRETREVRLVFITITLFNFSF
jgi:hypothetical protein